ncbi:hypothetical protein ABES03_06185 [Neobacillus rhizosphaerae]|uniref:hypothetical protein n=1 Tax=Neobacillus rhizosphaerae TaxID=2880965 RepID=UPI003D2D2D57
MAEIIGVSLWTLVTLRWGDWRNVKKYYATILYFLFCDVLYYYLSYNHRLWSITPTPPLTSEFVALVGEFIVFTGTIFLFLGRYPSNQFFSIRWTSLWVILYTTNEWVLLKTGTFVYEHGWTIVHSLLFNIFMFIFLRLHDQRPILTMILSIPIPFILIKLFSIPIR